jgi:hypothetical protein
MAMTLVSTVTVGSGGASEVLITGIPQTGKDLLAVLSVRGTSAEANDEIRIALNDDSSGFSSRYLGGNGAAASSFTSEGSANSSVSIYVLQNSSTSTASTFGNLATYVANYTSSSTKSVSTDAVSEQNGTTAFQRIVASSYTGGAITSFKVSTYDGSLAQHSTVSLYIIS